jgi:hypothetical protein
MMPKEVESFEHLLKDRMAEGMKGELEVSLGEGCGMLLENGPFEWVVMELVNNCAEKDATDIHIKVAIELDASDQFTLRVEDNVFYSQEIAEDLLSNLLSSKPVRKDKSAVRQSEGGAGLAMCRRIFEKWGGGLTYELTPDNRIVAVATWDKEKFLTVKK